MDYNRIINATVGSMPQSNITKFFDVLNSQYISFGVGEPDFPTPAEFRLPALRELSEGRIPYTGVLGDPELRELILRYLDERMGLSYPDIDSIMVTSGASAAIDLALRCFIDPGDEVIIHEPSYISYAPEVRFAGGVPVSVPTKAENGFRLTADELQSHITPKTKALIFAYPNNPTGAVMRREHLEPLARVLKDKNIVVISDEIYSELTYGDKRHCSIASMPDMRDKTLLINGFSKTFSMTGWRMGYAAGPKPLIDAMKKMHILTALCAPTTGQVCARHALRVSFETDFALVNSMIEQYDSRRTYMMNRLNAMGLRCFEPEGAFYLFPSIKHTGLGCEQFCDELLSSKKVAFVPGTAFGPYGEGYVRCCYATSMSDIQEGMDRAESFLKERGFLH